MCDSKRDSWPWILAPSLTIFTNHLTLGCLTSVSKFLTCSHTDIACPIGKITPQWFVEGIIKALWGEELVPWLVHGESSIFAQLCPLIVVLGEQFTLFRHCEYLKVRDHWLLVYASPTTSRECLLPRSKTARWRKARILAPKSPGEAWCYHFLLCGLGKITWGLCDLVLSSVK